MSIERPDVAWLPLRTGVLKYQNAKAFQVWQGPPPLSDIFRLSGKRMLDLSAADLVQMVCDRTTAAIHRAGLTYREEDASFDIYFAGESQPHDGEFEGFPDATFRDVVVSFRLGECAEDIDYFAELSPLQRESVKSIIDELQRQFERLIQVHLREGLCRVRARVGSSLAEYIDISADAFAHFSITDWKLGVAKSLNGETLFSIHLAPVLNGEAAALNDDELPSGLPGRPSSKHLYRAEAERRIAQGDYPDTLAAFVRQLVDWLKQAHPKAAPGGESAIENAIRDIWQKRVEIRTKPVP
jgi:hypothetical protein